MTMTVTEHLITTKRKLHPNDGRYPCRSCMEILSAGLKLITSLSTEERELLKTNQLILDKDETEELFLSMKEKDIIGIGLVRKTGFTANKYEIVNQSTENALTYGHRRKINYYDRRGNWNERSGTFKIFDMDSITTPGIENNGVILKGAPGDQNFLNNNVKQLYIGKLDKDNMHENAPYAYAQNKQKHLISKGVFPRLPWQTRQLGQPPRFRLRIPRKVIPTIRQPILP